MVLTKRERVIRTLELEEPDLIPIHTFGFEQTGTSFQAFKQSEEYIKYHSWVKSNLSKVKYYLTQYRFWNIDIYAIDPWSPSKLKAKTKKAKESKEEKKE